MTKSLNDTLVQLDGQAHDYLIVGAPGTGKTPIVLALVAGALSAPMPVTILDNGRTYERFCGRTGGTYVSLNDVGQVSAETFGQAPLCVVDFAALRGMWHGELPGVGDVASKGGLLVVDETSSVHEHYPEVLGLVSRHAANGGRYCVTGQVLQDVVPFSQLSQRVRLLNLSLVDQDQIRA